MLSINDTVIFPFIDILTHTGIQNLRMKNEHDLFKDKNDNLYGLKQIEMIIEAYVYLMVLEPNFAQNKN